MEPKPPRAFRFSMATAMFAVVAAALAFTIFARLRDRITATPAGLPTVAVDVPAAFVIGIALTATGLGALKSHSPNQVLLQVSLAYLSYLGLILLAEAGAYRPLLYWTQLGCLLQAVLPLIARARIKAAMGRGPRRTWWKKTTEAIVFSYLTVFIVMVSGWLHWATALVVKAGNQILNL